MKEKDLKKLFKKYIDECQFTRDLRPATLRGYKAAFDLLNAIVPDLTLETLNEENMHYFFKALKTRTRTIGKNTKKTGVRSSTSRTYWNKLNTFFMWLYTKEIIKKNPLKNVNVPHPTYTDSPALTLDDVDKLYAAIAVHSKSSLVRRRDTMMISILRYQGLRKGELLSLYVSDVDMDKKIITVRGETSKSRETRSLPIHPVLFQHLDDYLEERKKRGYKTQLLIVSSNNDKGLSADGLKHWVDRLIENSGVKFHLHQLRHTFACEFVKKGLGSVLLQKAMGHKDPRMTERYTRSIKVEDLRSAFNQL